VVTGELVGVILAGGQGSRMGGADKALLRLGGETLLARAERRLGTQVAEVVVSANGDAGRLGTGRVVLPDPVGGFVGPLGGVLAGLAFAEARGVAGIVTVAVDTPFFPGDLAARLGAAGGVAVAEAGGRWQGTFTLWPVEVRDAVAAALARGERKVRAVAEAVGAVPVAFDSPDAFFNINTPGDLARAERMLKERG
jgi:molybdopterin-guanine dinucleotide biosynthesis protein A